MGMAIYRVFLHLWLSCFLQQLKDRLQSLGACRADQFQVAKCILDDAGAGAD